MGYTDARRYLEVGRDLGVYHTVPPERQWVLNFWPPGMHVFYGAIFAVLGPEMPLGVVVAVACSRCCWRPC